MDIYFKHNFFRDLQDIFFQQTDISYWTLRGNSVTQTDSKACSNCSHVHYESSWPEMEKMSVEEYEFMLIPAIAPPVVWAKAKTLQLCSLVCLFFSSHKKQTAQFGLSIHLLVLNPVLFTHTAVIYRSNKYLLMIYLNVHQSCLFCMCIAWNQISNPNALTWK